MGMRITLAMCTVLSRQLSVSVSSLRSLCSDLCALCVKPLGPFLSGVCGGAPAGNFVALLFPAEDGFAHSPHCFHCFRAGALGAVVTHLRDALRLLLVLHPARAGGGDRLDQIVHHGCC